MEIPKIVMDIFYNMLKNRAEHVKNAGFAILLFFTSLLHFPNFFLFSIFWLCSKLFYSFCSYEFTILKIDFLF